MEVEVVLIDGDVIPYELGSLKDQHPFGAKDKDGNIITIPIDGAYLERLISNKIESIMDKTGAKRYEMILSGKGNWRFDIARQQPYKGNRVGLEKPYNWQTVRDYIEKTYNPFITKGYEGDDELIHRLREYKKNNILACVASIDKDMRTESGWHFNWRKDNGPVFISEIEALKFFYYQILAGDDADGIPGCAYKRKTLGKAGNKEGVGYIRRYGIRGAKGLVEACTTEYEMYLTCLEQYSKKFSPEEAYDIMLESARLLWMGTRDLTELYNFPKFEEEQK